MADAVIANWDGHDYQARFFWIHASGLRDPEKAHVVEVSYEADGPKGFDDVVVRYDPGLEARRSFRVRHAHHQIKYHVNQSGRFGYADLIEPDFIGAEKVSILQRLRDAVRKCAPGSTFTLVTTDRIFDNDPLNKLIRKSDNALDVDKLFDGTTDRSAMGKIRKLWREHLGLSSDEELREIVDTFHLIDSYHSLEAMRENVDLYFKLVGLAAGGNTLEFKFDGAARKLKATQRNVLTREAFDELCLEQGWIRATQPEDRKNIAVRSFSDGPTDYLDASPENTLSLLHLFDDRHLQAGADWNAQVRPAIEEFLVRVRQTDKDIRLFLNSHSSIAFLAGALLGFKTTTHVELNQKGRGPTSVWRSDDGKTGPPATTELHEISDGEEIAVVISLSRNAFSDVVDYAKARLPGVGRLLHVVAANGAGQQSLAGGQHAAALADQIADALKAARPKFGSRRHFFISAPNAFTFFMGQHRDAMGPVTLYEFDFKGAVDGSYHPSFRID